jgi:hypothetical protein
MGYIRTKLEIITQGAGFGSIKVVKMKEEIISILK